MIICTATSGTSADCTEHTVRLASFPSRFTLLGNNLFFASPGSKESPGDGIVRFDLTNYTSTLLPLELGIIAAGQDGLLYVYKHSSKSITAFDPHSLVKIREVALPFRDIDYPASIAVDTKGYMYVENGLWNGRILKFDPQGKVVNSREFPNAVFGFRNSSDGYLLVNNLFQDTSNPSYPYRWETLLLNSDLEIQWRKSLGRSPVGAIVEMECVRSPITLKISKSGEPHVAKSSLTQDFTVTVRNNDSTLCGQQPVGLVLSSSSHAGTLLGAASSTLKPGEGFTTQLRIEAPLTFVGSSHFDIQARGEISAAVTKKTVTFLLESPSKSTQGLVNGAKTQSCTTSPTPVAPHRLKVTKKGARLRFTWRAPSKDTKRNKYLVYVDGEFLKSVSATDLTVPLVRIAKGVHTFSVRALDDNSTMSAEARLKFFR
jgi:hypothetical protein